MATDTTNLGAVLERVEGPERLAACWRERGAWPVRGEGCLRPSWFPVHGHTDLELHWSRGGRARRTSVRARAGAGA